MEMLTFIFSIWIANLFRNIILLGRHVIPNTGEVGPLEVSVQIDLDYTIGYRLLVLLIIRNEVSLSQ
jgi:hypothetical protein